MMAVCCFCDFFDFLAFVGFFDLSVEAIADLPLPPLPATAGVRVVTPNRPRMLMIAISLRISVLPVCPALLRMASLRGAPGCGNHPDRERARAVLFLRQR